MAVATGVADVVVAYRGFNERSESRFGQVSVAAATQVNTNGLDNAWTYPLGLGTPAATVAKIWPAAVPLLMPKSPLNLLPDASKR